MKYFVFDSRIIRHTQNAVQRYGAVKKHSANPLFCEDFFSDCPREWEARFDNVYPSVIYDESEGIFKCWYTVFIKDEASSDTPLVRRPYESYREKIKDDTREMGVCYAFSSDGVSWQKPDLGLLEFNGSTKNNLVMRGIHGAGVFKDTRDCGGRAYKALFKSYSLPGKPMCAAFSGDGLHWSAPVPWPEFNAAGDCHNNAFWDEQTGMYIGITRLWRQGLRVVGRTESADFINWSEPKEVFSGESANDQIYSMPVLPYEGLYLGLPSVFNCGNKSSPDWDSVRCELAWSADTHVWNRICPGGEFIPRGKGRYPAGEYDCGCVYAAAYPVVRGDETLLFYAGSNGLHTEYREGSLNLAMIKTDRFACIQPDNPEREAVVYTQKVSGKFKTLKVNAAIREGGYIKASIAGAGGKALPEYCADCSMLSSGGLYRELLWDKKAPGGFPAEVFMEFRLRGAEFYSFELI